MDGMWDVDRMRWDEMGWGEMRKEKRERRKEKTW